MKKFWKPMWEKMIKWVKFVSFWQILTVIIIFIGYYFYRDWVTHTSYQIVRWCFSNPEVTRNVIYIVALLVSIFGGYCLHRRTKATEQGLTVEQFTRAMEQLASDKISIRIGGILSLEQIAEVHETERTKIIQIIAARIRELAPKKYTKKLELRNKRIDIEFAVHTLARIAEPLSKNEKRDLCQLDSTNLSYLFFPDVNLSHFGFIGTNFTNAVFFGANFTGTDLNGTNLSDTDFFASEGLTSEQISTAFSWEGQPPINLPDRLKPPPTKIRPPNLPRLPRNE